MLIRFMSRAEEFGLAAYNICLSLCAQGGLKYAKRLHFAVQIHQMLINHSSHFFAVRGLALHDFSVPAPNEFLHHLFCIRLGDTEINTRTCVYKRELEKVRGMGLSNVGF